MNRSQGKQLIVIDLKKKRDVFRIQAVDAEWISETKLKVVKSVGLNTVKSPNGLKTYYFDIINGKGFPAKPILKSNKP